MLRCKEQKNLLHLLSDTDLRGDQSLSLTLLHHFASFKGCSLCLKSSVTKENTCAIIQSDVQTRYSHSYIIMNVSGGLQRHQSPLRETVQLVKMKMPLAFDLIVTMAISKEHCANLYGMRNKHTFGLDISSICTVIHPASA